MRMKTLTITAAAALVALAGCMAPVSETTEASPSQISVDDTAVTEDHGEPVVTWGPTTDQDVKALATDLMTKFARPSVTARAWFDSLQPHMSADYQSSAEYIQPNRIPVTTVTGEPKLVREKGNPMSVTAEFSTNNGPWVMSLHRSGQEEPWLITSIAPKDS